MGLSVRALHFRDAVIGDRMLKLARLDSLPQVQRSDGAGSSTAGSSAPPPPSSVPRAVAMLSEFGGAGKERAPVSGDRSSRVNRGQLPPRLQESRQEDGAEFLQLRAKTEDALKNLAVQGSRKYRTQAGKDFIALQALLGNTLPFGGLVLIAPGDLYAIALEPPDLSSR